MTDAPDSLAGIHHITAICADPQRNVDFYAGVLGLRLVKKTVNFDDPSSYHLYYGDGMGSPGTIMTFFAWLLPPGVTARARQGTGQVAATPFWIPPQSLDFWVDRLASAAIDFGGPEPRFDEQVITLTDPDRLPLELVARDGAPAAAAWRDAPVAAEHAMRGFAGATLDLNGYERTATLLTATMGLRQGAAEGSRFRFAIGDDHGPAAIDLLCRPEAQAGRIGIGAVHHIAWRASSPEAQLRWRSRLASAGLDVTPVLDREYFRLTYFREPGGVLFEIATDGPGFAVDEPIDELGTHLRLPPWLESRRSGIEARLPDIRTPAPAR